MNQNQKQSKEPIIIYVDTGIANIIGDCIFLHKSLQQPKYKAYHDYLLAHEKEHFNNRQGKHNHTADFLTDLFTGFKHFFTNLEFIWHNKGAWQQLAPVRLIRDPRDKEPALIFDAFTMAAWAIVITLLVVYL